MSKSPPPPKSPPGGPPMPTGLSGGAGGFGLSATASDVFAATGEWIGMVGADYFLVLFKTLSHARAKSD